MRLKFYWIREGGLLFELWLGFSLVRPAVLAPILFNLMTVVPPFVIRESFIQWMRVHNLLHLSMNVSDVICLEAF